LKARPREVPQRQRRAEHLAQVGRVQGMCPADAGVWPLYARGRLQAGPYYDAGSGRALPGQAQGHGLASVAEAVGQGLR
jgi:hypothetical protein